MDYKELLDCVKEKKISSMVELIKMSGMSYLDIADEFLKNNRMPEYKEMFDEFSKNYDAQESKQ